MELAVEMSANEYIEEPLPPAVTCRAYSAVGIRPGQSTWERYEILVRYLQATGRRPRPSPGEEGAANVDDHRFFARGKMLPGATAQTAILVERAVSESRQERARNRPPPPRPPASQGESGEARPTEHPRDHRGDADGDSKAATTRRRPHPATLPRRRAVSRRPRRRALRDDAARPRRSWTGGPPLAVFVARARSPVHTWSRPSRRFPTRIFEVPGRSWAPRRSENPRLLVAIDTSLSMTKLELEEIARHLVILGERAHVTIVECDVSMARVYPFAGHIENVVGRGGTDLRPVFEPSILGAHDVDGVVYFTDGDGPFSEGSSPRPNALGAHQAWRVSLRVGGESVASASAPRLTVGSLEPRDGRRSRRGSRRGLREAIRTERIRRFP